MMMNATMMVSLAIASIATQSVPIRTIGVAAGCLSATTAVFWLWAVIAGKLPEPSAEAESAETFESPVTPA